MDIFLFLEPKPVELPSSVLVGALVGGS